MNVTTGSGAPGCGSVLGVNSGRVSGFGVLGMWKHNTTGSTAIRYSVGAGIAVGRGLTSACSDKRFRLKAPRGLRTRGAELRNVR